MMQNVVVVKCIVWGDVRMATANVSKKSGQRIMDRVTDDIKASIRFIQSYFSRYLDRMLTPPLLRMLVFTQGRIKLLGGPVRNVDGGPCPVLPLSRSVCPTLPYPSHRHAPL